MPTQRTLAPAIFVLSVTALIPILVYGASFQGKDYSQGDAWLYMLGLLIAIIVVLTIGTINLRGDYPKRRLVLHAPVYITVYLIVMYGIPGLLGFFNPDLLLSLNTLVGVDYIYAAVGWLLVLVGTYCMWVGYRLGLSGIAQTVPPDRPLPQPGSTLILWLFTIVLRVVSALVEGRGFGQNVNNWGPVLSLFNNTLGYLEASHYLVIVILMLHCLRGQCSRIFFYFVLGLELLWASTSAFSSQAWFIVVICSLTYIYEKRRLKIRLQSILLVIGLLFTSIAIVPIAQSLRTLNYNSQSFDEIAGAMQNAISISWGQGIDHGLSIFQTKIFNRQAFVAQMPGIIFRDTPSRVEYQGLSEFMLIPAYVLPRFLWQDKPILSRSVWFSVAYLNYPDMTNSSSAMTIFGEAYMFSGWVTLIIGLFVFGLILAMVYRATVNRGLSFLCIAIIPAYIHIEGQFTTIVVGTIQRTLVSYLVYWILIQLSSKSSMVIKTKVSNIHQS